VDFELNRAVGAVSPELLTELADRPGDAMKLWSMRVREPMLAANLAASTADEIAPGPTAVEERLNKAIDALLLCVDGFAGVESLIKS
jgi:hypothetical protein